MLRAAIWVGELWIIFICFFELFCLALFFLIPEREEWGREGGNRERGTGVERERLRERERHTD